MKADSRDLAVEAGEEIRETRMDWARGMVGGGVTWARRVVGWVRFA